MSKIDHEGNGLEIFRLFCEALSPEEREKIEIVAGDGAQWIDSCTKAYFPNATRCIDFFHVVEWANEKLDKVRTSTAAKASREYDRRKQEFQKAEMRNILRSMRPQSLPGSEQQPYIGGSETTASRLSVFHQK